MTVTATSLSRNGRPMTAGSAAWAVRQNRSLMTTVRVSAARAAAVESKSKVRPRTAATPSTSK